MKKYLNMILAVAASVICFSCTQEEPDGSQYAAKPTIEIVSKDDVFAPEGGEGIVEVKTNEAVTAKATGSWLSVEVNGSIIKLTATPNETIESRYSILDISAGDAFSSITIQQSGKTSDKMWEEAYTFAAAGGDVSLAYSGSGMVRVSVPQGKEWISTELYKENNEDYLKISVEANLYKAAREGQVCFVMGSDTTKVGVVQAGNPNGLNPGDPEPKEFIEQSVWTPKYYGISPSDDTKAIIGVEAEEGSSAGRYFLKVVTAAEYNAVGDQFTYLNLNASAWAAENPEICRDTDQIEIDLLSNGSYYLYAIGVDNDGKVNYKYAVAAFSVTKELSPYDKFLGTWRITRGSYEDTWTITEKVPDQSYSITGFESLDADAVITATFNATDSTMVIAAQSNVGTYTITNSGEQTTVTLSLMGVVEMSGRLVPVGGSYPICSAAITGDGEMTLSAADPIKLSDGNTYDIVGVEFFGQDDPNSSSGWTFNDRTPSRFPFVATQLGQGEGSGGGGGGGGGETTGYNAWLGTWNAGNARFTISQKTAGSTYTVSGLEDDIEFEARYANGKLEFFYQVIAASGTQELCLYGIDDDGDGYIVTGDPANDGWLATATLNSAGTSASLVGAEFDAVYSGTTYHERIVTMQLLVYDDSDGKFYYVSDNPTPIDMP
ncbi:MAG: hypothetical protein K6F21_01715, partial [Bacteroidales bacterium]|nr:hypothetical protein [Bacteroidales bacterium]